MCFGTVECSEPRGDDSGSPQSFLYRRLDDVPASPSPSPSTAGSLGQVTAGTRFPASDTAARDLGLKTGSSLGSASVNIGDLDSNGFEDAVVSVPQGRGSPSSSAELLVLLMDSSGNPTSTFGLRAGVNGVGSGFTQSAGHNGLPVAAMRGGQPLGDDPIVPRLFAGLSQKNVGASSKAGELYTWRLSSSGVVYGEKVWSLPANLASGAEFGSALASMGDVSGDGLRDLAVGAAGRQSVFILSLAANDSVQFFSEIRAADLSLPLFSNTGTAFGKAGLAAARSTGAELGLSALAHDLFIGDPEADESWGAVFVITVMDVSPPAAGLEKTTAGTVRRSGSPVTIGRDRGGLARSYFSADPNYFGTAVMLAGNLWGTGRPVLGVSMTSLRTGLDLRLGGVYLLELNPSTRTVVGVTELSHRTSSAIGDLVTTQPGGIITINGGSSLGFYPGRPASAFGRLLIGASAYGYASATNGGALMSIDVRVAPQAFSPSPSVTPSPTASMFSTPSPSSTPAGPGVIRSATAIEHNAGGTDSP